MTKCTSPVSTFSTIHFLTSGLMLKKLATPFVNRDHIEPRFFGAAASRRDGGIKIRCKIDSSFLISCIAIRFLILLGTRTSYGFSGLSLKLPIRMPRNVLKIYRTILAPITSTTTIIWILDTRSHPIYPTRFRVFLILFLRCHFFLCHNITIIAKPEYEVKCFLKKI